MRIMDWSSDVCSSDLENQTLRESQGFCRLLVQRSGTKHGFFPPHGCPVAAPKDWYFLLPPGSARSAARDDRFARDQGLPAYEDSARGDAALCPRGVSLSGALRQGLGGPADVRAHTAAGRARSVTEPRKH